MKKIVLFAVWMVALSMFVYKMAYAGECPMMAGSAPSEPAMCAVSVDDKSSGKVCAMKEGKTCTMAKMNFVAGNKKTNI